MFLTTIPIPHSDIQCHEGILATTPFEYLQRTVNIYLHGGLYINGVKICGDYMFSGYVVPVFVFRTVFFWKLWLFYDHRLICWMKKF